MVYKRFNVVCDRWELEFKFRKRITNLEDLSEFLAKEFPHEEVIMLIIDKLHLLREDPKKYAKEKLKNQTDKDGRPLFSIEVTGDIRIVYSFEPKNCTVFIWRIGRHKKAYRF
jgi:mRNA-degrading endonuclease RelE of RelBE toxin-antitoxin system